MESENERSGLIDSELTTLIYHGSLVCFSGKVLKCLSRVSVEKRLP